MSAGEALLQSLLSALEPAPEVVMAADLRGRARACLEQAGIAGPWLLLADENTAPVLGERVAAETGARLLRLTRPQASLSLAERLLAEVVAGTAPGAVVAVGGGTLTDLAKYVAHRAGLPCAVFATAPSMNGWLTATASLARRRLKHSLPVAPPRAAFFDLAVLARAPLRLRRAGLGDALCRTTVVTDLRLAAALGRAPPMDPALAGQRAVEAEVLAALDGILAGEIEAVAALVRWLLIQSLIMRRVGSSAPASQGEHAIAHLLDAATPPGRVLHGEQVALATYHLARLQATMLHRPHPPALAPVRPRAAAIARTPGLDPHQARRVLAAKGLHRAGAVRALRRRLAVLWPQLRAAHASSALPLARIEEVWARAGLPRHPAALGYDTAVWVRARRLAFLQRERFGWLDLEALAAAAD